MPTIVQFKNNFNHFHEFPVSLVTVISINNEKQSGENFKAFILALNELHKTNYIDKLTIVVSGNLHRHYICLNKNLTEEEVNYFSKKIDKSWIIDNKPTLNIINFPYEVITWNKLLENKQQMQIISDNVTSDYVKDEQFREKVDQHSGQYYAEKLFKKLQNEIPDIKFDDCRKAAVNYVLEECVVLEKLNAQADYLVYPGKMNPCVDHIHTKYFSIRKKFIQYNEYMLKTIPTKIPIANDLCSKEKSTSKKAIRHHVLNETKRILNNAEPMKVYFFLKGFNKLVSDVKKDEEKYICTHRRFSL